jgi:hypothetical protein
MTTPVELQKLVGYIASAFPSAKVEWDPLSSGVCILWVTLNDRNFELDYHPTQGTGVSENFEDTPPFIGHDEPFDSLDEAVERFTELLASAARGERPARTSAMALHDKNLPK